MGVRRVIVVGGEDLYQYLFICDATRIMFAVVLLALHARLLLLLLLLLLIRLLLLQGSVLVGV